MIKVETGEFEDFFAVPFVTYPRECLYVSPLKSDLKRFLSPKRNPLFRHGSEIEIFTAHKNGQLSGRITAHMHAQSNAHYGESLAYFGYFDCVDDDAVAKALLEAAEDWARRRGFTEIRGNFNLTAMQQIGVVTSGFEREAYTDLVYSPPQIARVLEANGYQAFFPMTSFELDLTTAQPAKITEKQLRILENPDFRFVPITRRDIDARMEDARQILNASFAKNPMFVPVSQEEFHFQAKDMKWVMDPRISKLLYYRDQPAAVIICIPDLNPFLRRVQSRARLSMPYHYLKHRWRNKRAVLIFSGVIPELQGQGVNPLVLHEVVKALQEAGYERLGNTWISDQNKASLAQKQKSGAEPLHRLHLYRKAL